MVGGHEDLLHFEVMDQRKEHHGSEIRVQGTSSILLIPSEEGRVSIPLVQETESQYFSKLTADG